MKKFFILGLLFLTSVGFMGCEIKKEDKPNITPETQYNITIIQSQNGSVSTNLSSAVAGTEILVNVYPDNNYILQPNSLKYNDNLIENNTFIMPNYDVGVTASFDLIPEETYNVSFLPYNGEPTIDEELSVITQFPVLQKQGYDLVGWYDNFEFEGYEIELPFMVDEQISVYAKWELSVYTITYHYNDGDNAETNLNEYTILTNTFYLKSPVYTSQAFAGWYATPNFDGNAITSIVKGSTGNLELFGKYLSSSESTPGLLFLIFADNSKCNVSQGTADISNGIIIPDYYAGVPVTGINSTGFSKSANNGITVPFLILPNNLIYIFTQAFSGLDMSGINLIIPDSVEQISQGAFQSTKIGSVQISQNSNLKSIGSQAFSGTNINYFYLPPNVTSVSSDSFYLGKTITIAVSYSIPSSIIAKWHETWCRAGWNVSVNGYFYHNVIYTY